MAYLYQDVYDLLILGIYLSIFVIQSHGTEYNILNNENNKDLLLTSDAKDKSIFLWRAEIEIVDIKWRLLFQMYHLTLVNIENFPWNLRTLNKNKPYHMFTKLLMRVKE
ncbi:gem-associated protein 5-like [Vespula squamosa]|uniref:Gem-associated protein 5-like n=1 Tax=Vespula squamosa TaxID=30214 RepID=A0ABD2C202_VESSQ